MALMRRFTLLLVQVVSVHALMVAALTPAAAAPLDDVLAAAIGHDPRLVEAEAASARARADVVVARAALLPSVQANAGYTRNQVGAEFTVPGQADPVVVQAVDALDATLRLDVPLIDAGAIVGLNAAARCRDAARAREDATVTEALLDVVRKAHDARSASAALEAAKAAVDAQTALASSVEARAGQGTASELDALRVRADLARAVEDAAVARGEAARARRALAAVTGLSDVPAALPAREVPVGSADAPALVAARAEQACRAAELSEARLGYAPRVAGFAQERVSNVTGFAGKAAVWSAGVSASWTLLDGGAREGRVLGAVAGARTAAAALDRTERDVGDAVASAQEDVDSAVAGVDAARARLDAVSRAESVARQRFDAGVGAAADVSVAVRDLQDARVALARAEGRHAVAIEALRAALGLPLVGGAS